MIKTIFKWGIIPLAVISYVGGNALASAAGGTAGHSIGAGTGAFMHGVKEITVGLREAQAYEAKGN